MDNKTDDGSSRAENEKVLSHILRRFTCYSCALLVFNNVPIKLTKISDRYYKILEYVKYMWIFKGRNNFEPLINFKCSSVEKWNM